MQLVSLCSIALLLFFIVSLLILRLKNINNKPLWGDGFTYLRTARQIAETGTLPDTLDFYRLGNKQGDLFTLPPLLMLLLVPFHRMDYRVLANIPYSIDLLIAIAIYFFSHSLLGATYLQATTASLIYLLSPINTFTQTQITPRQLGALFLLLFASFYSLYIQRDNLVYLYFCPFWVCFLLLSQRMVTQILFLGAPFIAIFLAFIDPKFSIIFILCLAGGFLLALLLTAGRYKIIIYDHFRRVHQHAKHGDQSTFRKNFGNPFHIFKANPWIILLCLLLTIYGIPDLYMIVPLGYLAAAMLLSVVWVFGNSVNHVYFASPFAALFLSPYLFVNYPETFLMLTFATGCFFLIYREYTAIAKHQIHQHWLDCFDWINRKGLDGSALVLPGIACPPLVYYTNLKLISAGHGSQAMEFNRLFLGKNSSNPQFIKKFVNDADIAFILLQKNRLQETNRVSQDFVYPVLFENDTLCLLATKE